MNLCDVHQQKIKLQCSTCKINVCVRCITDNHRGHIFDHIQQTLAQKRYKRNDISVNNNNNGDDIKVTTAIDLQTIPKKINNNSSSSSGNWDQLLSHYNQLQLSQQTTSTNMLFSNIFNINNTTHINNNDHSKDRDSNNKNDIQMD